MKKGTRRPGSPSLNLSADWMVVIIWVNQAPKSTVLINSHQM